VLDTERLKRHGTIRLQGDFTLDAISRDGGLLYLIETEGDRYAVRAYDVEARRLLPDPVADPKEPDEPMQGARSPAPRARTVAGPTRSTTPRSRSSTRTTSRCSSSTPSASPCASRARRRLPQLAHQTRTAAAAGSSSPAGSG